MPFVAAALPGILMNVAVGVGFSLFANAIRPQRQTQQVSRPSGLRFEVATGEATALSAIWGRGRTAGQLTFAQEYGANNSWLKMKFDCGRGWYDGFETLIADEKKLTLSGSNDDVHGRVVEEYRDAAGTARMWIKAYDGRPGQAADAGLIAAAPTRWGDAHTSTATPYVIVTLNYQADMFANGGLPRFGFVWRGLRQYDWRFDSTMPGGLGEQRWADQSTWAWSENPAVLAWNFRRGYWRNGVKLFGMGFSQYANDLDYFTAAANLADEEMYYAETGATLARYAFGREISDDQEHLSVLREFEASWCGSSFDRGGAYAPVPAQQRTPVLTLTDADLVDGAPISADKWGKVSAKKTQIHGTYASISDLFTPTPFGTRINLPLETLTRGPKPEALDQLYEHRLERAQMRAELTMRRHNFGATRSETFAAVANVLEPGDVFTRDCEWGPTLMMVDGVEPNRDGPGRMITAIAWDNSIVPDAHEGFIVLPSAPGAEPVAAVRTLQVPDFAVVPLQRVTGGNEEPFARATWAAITDPNCDQVVIRVWPTAMPDEVEEFSAPARLATAKIIGPLRPNTNYTSIALLTRSDLRRTFETDPSLFETGGFKPGHIGSADLSAEVNAARAWAARSIEQHRADTDAMAALLADALLGGAVDRQEMRTEVTARFGTSEARYDKKIELVAGELGALVTFTEAFKASYEANNAAVSTSINAISTGLGALASRTDAVEATINDEETGLTAVAAAFIQFQSTVNADLEAKSAAILAVEASIGDVLAGGMIGIEAVTAPAGWSVRAQFSIRGEPGGPLLPVGLYMDAKSDGTRRIVLDADEVVFTGKARSESGLSFLDFTRGAQRLGG